MGWTASGPPKLQGAARVSAQLFFTYGLAEACRRLTDHTAHEHSAAFGSFALDRHSGGKTERGAVASRVLCRVVTRPTLGTGCSRTVRRLESRRQDVGAREWSRSGSHSVKPCEAEGVSPSDGLGTSSRSPGICPVPRRRTCVRRVLENDELRVGWHLGHHFRGTCHAAPVMASGRLAALQFLTHRELPWSRTYTFSPSDSPGMRIPVVSGQLKSHFAMVPAPREARQIHRSPVFSASRYSKKADLPSAHLSSTKRISPCNLTAPLAQSGHLGAGVYLP